MSIEDENSITCVITGMGAVSAVGRGVAALWEAVAGGRDGIAPVTRFSTAELSVHLGAEVPEDAGDWPDKGRCVPYALAAAWEAWTQARLDDADVPPQRIALVLGTSVGHEQLHLERYAEEVGCELGIKGPRLTVSTACSSSCNALGLARDLILDGAAELVLAGGVDELTPEVFAGFHALGVLSADKCAPFSLPVGTNLGEGAGFLVVEAASLARRRGAEVLAGISGYGLAADAHHETTPDPKGEGMARAIAAALGDAGLSPEQVAYVNAHGTGTAANDAAEWAAVRRVFGDEALPAISATKSQIGHAQGAAGALETIVTIQAMRRGVVPPTAHFDVPRQGGPADPVAGDRPQPLEVSHALCANAAFGGANAVLVVSAPDETTPAVARTRRVRVLGVGAVGPHGLTLDALDTALVQGEPLDGRVVGFEIERLVRGVDPRGLDPASQFLTAAAHGALQDAGVRVRGALRARTGIIAGATSVSASSALSFLESIEQRGLARLSATAFARMVLNATAGACSMNLSLKGPTSTLCTGPGSGLLAVIYAAQMLRRHGDADLMLAGGFDERPPTPLRDGPQEPPSPPDAEGATCLLLGADNGFESPGGPIFLAGWGMAGPRRLSDAVDAALARAGRGPGDVEGVFGHLTSAAKVATEGMNGSGPRWFDPTPVLGWAPASGACQAAAAAVLAIRRGEVHTGLVLSAEGDSTCTALILTRGE